MDPSQREIIEAEVANFIYKDCTSNVNNANVLNILLSVRNDEEKLAKALQSRSVITKATMAALILSFCDANNMSGPPQVVDDEGDKGLADDDDEFLDSVEKPVKESSVLVPETTSGSLTGNKNETDPPKPGGSGEDWHTQMSRKKKQAAVNAAKEEKNDNNKGKGGPFKNKKSSQTLSKTQHDTSSSGKACDAHSRGKCRFGYSGQKGGEKCQNIHQKVCSRHLTLLDPNGTGCNLSQKICQYLHIRICRSSLAGKMCDDRSCIYRHTTGMYSHEVKRKDSNKVPTQNQQKVAQPQKPSGVKPRGSSQPIKTPVFRPPASSPPPRGMTWALIANPNSRVQMGQPQTSPTVMTQQPMTMTSPEQTLQQQNMLLRASLQELLDQNNSITERAKKALAAQ